MPNLNAGASRARSDQNTTEAGAPLHGDHECRADSHQQPGLGQLGVERRLFRIIMSIAAFMFAVVFVLLGVWVTKSVENEHLLRSARSYASAIESFRQFYTEVIVTPVMGHPWVMVTDDYRGQPGAIPIPATMTIDLAEFMSGRDTQVHARMLSDLPFPQRADRTLTAFDQEALAALRKGTIREFHRLDVLNGESVLSFATPVYMEPSCVACHNNHAESPRTDWVVGDVRGIQVVSVPRSSALLDANPRLGYLVIFVFASFLLATGALFFMDERVRRAMNLLRVKNHELESTTSELAQRQQALDQHAIVSITDRDGDIIYCNEHFKRITGYTEDELLGRNHRIINSGHHPREMFDKLWRTILDGRVWNGEIRNKDKFGNQYWVKATIMPLLDTQGRIDRFISVRTDITHQKALEEELTRRNEELLAVNRHLEQARQEAENASAAKSQFLANMSHEIRTPMTGIIGMTELALDTTLSPTQRGYLETVQSSAEALLTILNDILDFSKMEAGKLTIEAVEFDPRNLLCASLKSQAVRARRKGLEFTLEIAPDLPSRMVGDPVRIRQMLTNICDNAIKFSTEGVVSVACHWQPGSADAGLLRFTVRDTGPGIDKDKQTTIFDAFAQADNSTTRRFGGTGLGLAICAHLVNMMQGRIGVDSAPGQGSLFWFELPLSASPDGERDRPHPLAGQRFRVIVEQAVNRETLVGLLDWLGATVESVPNLDALAGLPSSQGADEVIHVIGCADDATGLPAMLEDLEARGISSKRCIFICDNMTPSMLAALEQRGVAGILAPPPRPVELVEFAHHATGANANTRSFAPGAETEASTPARTAAPTVLLAEDNPTNQRLILTLLRKAGYDVVIANNGQEAVDLAHTTRFDAILMDMQMPVMGGLDATREIRRREHAAGIPRTPIIAMTANVLPEDRQACLEAGMDAHIGKPVRARMIEEQLAALIGAAT